MPDAPCNASCITTMSTKPPKDKAKTHKLSLKGSGRLVAEFVRLPTRTPSFLSANPFQFQYSIHTILYAAFAHAFVSFSSLTGQLPTRRVPRRRLHRVRAPVSAHPANVLASRNMASTCSVRHAVRKLYLSTANSLVSADDQVKAYIKKIMSQLDKWMVGGKISKLVIVITDKDTGEHVERWQFDVRRLK